MMVYQYGTGDGGPSGAEVSLSLPPYTETLFDSKSELYKKLAKEDAFHG